MNNNNYSKTFRKLFANKKYKKWLDSNTISYYGIIISMLFYNFFKGYLFINMIQSL